MTAIQARYVKETFGELNRRHRLRKPASGFDAGGAVLAAQCDGLDSRGPTNGRRQPAAYHWRVRFADDAGEYTLQTAVETMSYAKSPVSPHDPQEIRTGVQHFEVGTEEAGQRLDNYVQKHLPGVPRSRVYRVIRKGEVRVNGRRAGPELRLQAHDRVRLPPVRVAPAVDTGRPSPELTERIARAIVHEDEKLLVLDKPAGVAV